MSKKKVSFGTNPRSKEKVISPDEWVKKGTVSKKDTFRFTIDIPKELHARIKSHCALKSVKMKDEVQALLEKHFKQP